MSEKKEDQYIYINEYFILNNGKLAKIHFLTFNESKNDAVEHNDLEFAVTIDDKHIFYYNKTDGIKEKDFETISARQTELDNQRKELLEARLKKDSEHLIADDEAAPAEESAAAEEQAEDGEESAAAEEPATAKEPAAAEEPATAEKPAEKPAEDAAPEE